MAKKKRYYTVWVGRKPGVYDSWEECRQQTDGYPGAKFASFDTREEAEAAFNRSSAEYIGKKVFKSKLPPEQLALIGEPIMDSIAVDGACNSSTGIAEYRVVDVRSGELIHQSKEYADGTNNIVEFIAIVHALGYCKQKEKNLPIYSDSMTAITWVRNKAAKTKLIRSEKNQDLYDVLSRAVKWLHEHTYENPILKWQTKAWGENPADFGRK